VTLTVLLADDHVLFRQGLALLVAERAGWEVVAQAGDGEDAVQLAEALRPQIAVLDVEMPRLNGVEAARRIRKVSPATRIVALSMYGDLHYQERMFDAGASAYVLKNEAMDDLVAAIETTLRGERFVSPTAREGGPRQPDRGVDLDSTVLSDRERDVLRSLAAGLRTKEIAKTLGISAKTVETYRSRIMLKCGFGNFTDLVKFAIRAGIVRVE